MISDTFPHVQLLFFSSKRASGKWKVQKHLNKHFSPHATCLMACTIPKWLSSTFQRLPGLHSLAGDLVRKAKQRVIGVSRLSQSEVASQSRISGAGQHSFQLFPSKKGISASQVSFTCTSLLRPCQQEYLGTSLQTWKNQHKQESSPVGLYSVFHGNITNYNCILGIYYMFHCFHISEQNKTPSCMLRYRTVKQASLPGILKYQ